MIIEEAKRLILAEWQDWSANQSFEASDASGKEALLFFGHLQRLRADLLDFQCSDDKWQRVHGWLQNGGFIKNIM